MTSGACLKWEMATMTSRLSSTVTAQTAGSRMPEMTLKRKTCSEAEEDFLQERLASCGKQSSDCSIRTPGRHSGAALSERRI